MEGLCEKKACGMESSLTSLPMDCLAEITNFFDKPSDALSFLRLSKHFYEIGVSDSFFGLLNVNFALNDPTIVITGSYPYVKRFRLNHLFFHGLFQGIYDREECAEVFDHVFDQTPTVRAYLQCFPNLKVLDFTRYGFSINEGIFTSNSKLKCLTTLFLSPPLLNGNVLKNIGHDVILNLNAFGFEFIAYKKESGNSLRRNHDSNVLFNQFCKTLVIFERSSSSSKLRKVKILESRYSRDSYGSFNFLFLNHFKNVETLELKLTQCRHSVYYDKTEKGENQGMKIAKFTRLRHIDVNSYVGYGFISRLLVKKCETLESIEFCRFKSPRGIPREGLYHLDDLSELKRKFCPNLVSLVFRDFKGYRKRNFYSHTQTEKEKNDVRCLSTDLTHLDFRTCADVHQLFFQTLDHKELGNVEKITVNDVRKLFPFVAIENVILCCEAKSKAIARKPESEQNSEYWLLKNAGEDRYSKCVYCEFCVKKHECGVCKKRHVRRKFFKECAPYCSKCRKLACPSECLRKCKSCSTILCKDCDDKRKDYSFGSWKKYDDYTCSVCDAKRSEDYRVRSKGPKLTCEVCKVVSKFDTEPKGRCACCKKEFLYCCDVFKVVVDDEDLIIDRDKMDILTRDDFPLCSSCFNKNLALKCGKCRKKCSVFDLSSPTNWKLMLSTKRCNFCVGSEVGLPMGEVGLMMAMNMAQKDGGEEDGCEIM